MLRVGSTMALSLWSLSEVVKDKAALLELCALVCMYVCVYVHQLEPMSCPLVHRTEATETAARLLMELIFTMAS